MATEIERKFLIDPVKVPYNGNFKIITQGYLCTWPFVFRVRKVTEPAKVLKKIKAKHAGFITIKGKGNLSRKEYEFKIPYFIALCLLFFFVDELICKIRTKIEVENHTWEVDEFIRPGNIDGFHMAEIELKTEDEHFVKPFWALKEVTEDSRYSNVSLVKNGIPKQ